MKVLCIAGFAVEDKGEVVNNVVVVVVVKEAVVVVVADALARARQRRYLLKILMRILISTTQEIWRQTEERGSYLLETTASV